jgi:hypothetical protein
MTVRPKIVAAEPGRRPAAAGPWPTRPEDDIYESTIQRLIDIALPG